MSRYVLAFQNNHKKLKLCISGKSYLIYSTSLQETYSIPKDDFRLKEKLFILGYPLKVVWIKISDTHFSILKVFNNMVIPNQIKINVINGSVFPEIQKSYVE